VPSSFQAEVAVLAPLQGRHGGPPIYVAFTVLFYDLWMWPLSTTEVRFFLIFAD
jgi:hypothetical protein